MKPPISFSNLHCFLFSSNSWQEEALRDEQLAQEKIAVILANLTAKRTAMVSVLFAVYKIT